MGHRLGLDPLRGIHHQQRALARRQTAANFVGKVHVPWRIDEIEFVGLAVPSVVLHGHRMCFDRDAAFALQVHVVQHLVAPIPQGHRFRQLQQPVGERCLAVVNVGNDAEIADVRQLLRGASSLGGRRPLRGRFIILFVIFCSHKLLIDRA